jgi:hypothetical protein
MKWQTRINRAHKRGHFTEKDHSDASEWTSCAVDEVDHPEFKRAAKPDFGSKWFQLGMDFYRAVQDNDIPMAQVQLDLIKEYVDA